jgi:hypothetical protein
MSKTYPRLIAQLVGSCLGETFARRGFASTDIVTHWAEIVGQEVAAHAEPMKLQWPRETETGDEAGEPATLFLRVEGPAALEIQHLSGLILERVNRFFGYRAVGRIALRQAPLSRTKPVKRPVIDAEAVARIESNLDVEDNDLRQALARLGAAIERT